MHRLRIFSAFLVANFVLILSAVSGTCECGTSPGEFLRECSIASDSLKRSINASRHALADQLLDTVMDGVVPAELSATTGSLRTGESPGVVDPYELLRELCDAALCRKCGHPVSLNAEERKTLTGRRDAVFRHAAEVESGLPAEDSSSRQRLAAYCMAFPCVLVSDVDWDAKANEALPEWLRTGEWLDACERFALHAWRPRTAYQLACLRQREGEASAPVVFGEYQRRAAERMMQERDYIGQLACLRAALDEAKKLEDGKETGELAYLVAEAMTTYGQPLEGAKLLRGVLTQKPAVPDPGKLEVLRLTCLYKAEDYKVVSQDANQCLEEKRYPPRRVQFLYLAWAATRRVGEADKADKLAGDFLKSYPRHPLAADMLYAKAMGSLAQADYDGAYDTLKEIAKDFPDARVNERAGKLLARLDRLRTRDKDK